jgi:hypothetical protein
MALFIVWSGAWWATAGRKKIMLQQKVKTA